jgi:hypothetical protein
VREVDELPGYVLASGDDVSGDADNSNNRTDDDEDDTDNSPEQAGEHRIALQV